MVKWHRSDLENHMYVPLEDGKKIAMPRYYKTRVYTDFEREYIGKSIAAKDALLPQLTEQQIIDVIVDKNRRFYKNQRLNETL